MKTSHEHPLKRWAMKNGKDHSDQGLSDITGVSKQTINNICNCRNMAKEGTILKIHQATGGKVTGKILTNYYFDHHNGNSG